MSRSPRPVAPAERAAHADVTTVFTVVGMTCEHCVRAVTDEITDLVTGVGSVQVRLTDGQVTVVSAVRPTEAQLSAAVGEAGYVIAAGSLR